MSIHPKDRKDLFEHLGRLGDEEDKLADYRHWEKLGDEARFKAAWDLVVQAYELTGRNPDELRFQRSIENLIRK